FLRKSVSWVYKHWRELGGVKLGGSLLFPNKEDLYERLFGEGQGMALRLHSRRSALYRSLVQDKEKGTGCRIRKKKGARQTTKRKEGRTGKRRDRHNLLGDG